MQSGPGAGLQFCMTRESKADATNNIARPSTNIRLQEQYRLQMGDSVDALITVHVPNSCCVLIIKLKLGI